MFRLIFERIVFSFAIKTAIDYAYQPKFKQWSTNHNSWYRRRVRPRNPIWAPTFKDGMYTFHHGGIFNSVYIISHNFYILSRGNFLHLHRFCFSLVATLGSRICPMGASPLDIMYYNTPISICQVLFLEILLTPIMGTNLTISFWMQPIIFITVMLINQINKQTTYKQCQNCNPKYCSKNYFHCCRCHSTDLLYFVN